MTVRSVASGALRGYKRLVSPIVAGRLPLRTDLLGVRGRGDRETRYLARRYARREAAGPLRTLAPGRLRPGPPDVDDRKGPLTPVLLANFFSPLFDPLVRGMGDVLTGVHHVMPSYGWSLVIVALIVRVAIWPLSNMQFRSMAEMQKVQPLVKQLQAKFKNDPQGLNAATMALYKEHNVNPLAGCLPMLIQLPILFGLYYAIQEPGSRSSDESFAVDRLAGLLRRSTTGIRRLAPPSLASIGLPHAAAVRGLDVLHGAVRQPAVDRTRSRRKRRRSWRSCRRR